MKKNFKKINVIRAILIALIISVMVIIFVLSAQVGEESGATSEGFTAFILGIFGVNEGNTTPEKLEVVEGFVRTMAHFSEYAVLAFLCMFFLRTYSIKRALSLMFAVAFSAVYAVTDEIHQIFVPGRAAQFSDFVVDTSGAMFGACAALILSLMYISVLRFIKKRKNKKQKEKCS
jgi:VanZ family protein